MPRERFLYLPDSRAPRSRSRCPARSLSENLTRKISREECECRARAERAASFTGRQFVDLSELCSAGDLLHARFVRHEGFPEETGLRFSRGWIDKPRVAVYTLCLQVPNDVAGWIMWARTLSKTAPVLFVLSYFPIAHSIWMAFFEFRKCGYRNRRVSARIMWFATTVCWQWRSHG